MNFDLIFILSLLTISIITLGIIAPIFGFAISITWAAYGTTRYIQELANRKNVS
jgi:hypothetical protein